MPKIDLQLSDSISAESPYKNTSGSNTSWILKKQRVKNVAQIKELESQDSKKHPYNENERILGEGIIKTIQIGPPTKEQGV